MDNLNNGTFEGFLRCNIADSDSIQAILSHPEFQILWKIAISQDRRMVESLLWNLGHYYECTGIIQSIWVDILKIIICLGIALGSAMKDNLWDDQTYRSVADRLFKKVQAKFQENESDDKSLDDERHEYIRTSIESALTAGLMIAGIRLY